MILFYWIGIGILTYFDAIKIITKNKKKLKFVTIRRSYVYKLKDTQRINVAKSSDTAEHFAALSAMIQNPSKLPTWIFGHVYGSRTFRVVKIIINLYGW